MIVARVVFPSPGGPYSSTWSSASPRERAASIATAKFSLTLGCPINSASRCGRSFSSNDESSSTGAADTTRCFRSGTFLRVATAAMVRRKRESGNCGFRLPTDHVETAQYGCPVERKPIFIHGHVRCSTTSSPESSRTHTHQTCSVRSRSEERRVGKEGRCRVALYL